MPYDDEEISWQEPDPAMNALTSDVIAAAIEVHRHLGAGLDEGLYETAMAKELSARGIAFAKQVVLPVFYKGEQIGQKRLDFIIDERLVLELKAVT
jgi:GxxExxY protein